MAAVTVDQFLDIFPVFNDDNQYPIDRIQLWLAIANPQISFAQWRGLTQLGVSLWVAHYLTLDRTEWTAAEEGSVPGLSAGVLQSVNTGGVSTSYDTSETVFKGDNHWNKTTYGTRFRELERRVGAITLYVPPGGG